jgi:hypothetical protein
LPGLAMRTCPPNHLRPHRPPLRRYACVTIAPLVSPLPPHRCCTMSAVTPPDYPPSFYPSSAVSPRSFSAAVHRSHACHSPHLHLLVAPSCPTCSLNSAHARACPVRLPRRRRTRVRRAPPCPRASPAPYLHTPPTCPRTPVAHLLQCAAMPVSSCPPLCSLRGSPRRHTRPAPLRSFPAAAPARAGYHGLSLTRSHPRAIPFSTPRQHACPLLCPSCFCVRPPVRSLQHFPRAPFRPASHS